MGNDRDSVRACPNTARQGVTFFAVGSYIVRATMPTRRSARKGLLPKSSPPQKAGPTSQDGEGVPRDAGRDPDEQLLVETAQSDPANFDALYELHFERVYAFVASRVRNRRSEEHRSELQSHLNLVCRLLLEKKNNT